jgi:hypothetical protein
MKKKQKLPKGWTQAKIRELIAYYDKQTEDEEFEEIEAAYKSANITMMAVPTKLVPKVQAFLARRRSA